jgi:hypothetical protein
MLRREHPLRLWAGRTGVFKVIQAVANRQPMPQLTTPVSQVYANEPTILAHCRHRCLALTWPLTQ